MHGPVHLRDKVFNAFEWDFNFKKAVWKEDSNRQKMEKVTLTLDSGASVCAGLR